MKKILLLLLVSLISFSLLSLGWAKEKNTKLEGLKKGDRIIVRGYASRKVVNIKEKQYLLSKWHSTFADEDFGWFTQKELEELNFEFVEAEEEMIIIDGKKISYQTIKEALKEYLE